MLMTFRSTLSVYRSHQRLNPRFQAISATEFARALYSNSVLEHCLFGLDTQWKLASFLGIGEC